MKRHCFNGDFRSFLGVLVVFMSLLAPGRVGAQAPEVQGPTDPAEMAAFFDGVMLSTMDVEHIAGVSLAVVKDGEVFFSHGYGYADVEKHIAVDPATTLFRIASVSKLFTWTAVMQLVEQGKLDLDADVNTYLDFEIPATYPEPITLKHLLTHTPGFEDRFYGVNVKSAGDIVPLGEHLRTHIPARVRPAGTFSAYSNYGAALAGYIVERVSGMAYADYVERNIFQPLGMTHATARQPLPEALAADMAQGYIYTDGRYTPQPFELMLDVPAGAFSSSALDIARFMIAHLQNGRYGDAQILQEATAQQMHSRIFAHDERVSGFAHGFYEIHQNGQRFIVHGGDITAFHSELALFPEHNVGLFLTCNSDECARFTETVLIAFVDHYYPADEPISVPTSDFAQRAGLIAGTYRVNRLAYTSAESIVGLFSTMSFKAEDGVLAAQIPGEGTLRFVEVEPFVFRSEDGDTTLVFRQDAQGKVTHAFLGNSAAVALERVGLFATPLFHYGVMGLSVLLLLSTLVVWPAVFLARLGYEKKPQPGLAYVARWVAVGLSLACIVFAALFSLALPDNFEPLLMAAIPLLGVQPVVFWLMVALSLGMLVFTVLAWKNHYWSFVGRVHYALVMLAGWACVWFITYWHLLRW